MLKGIDINGLAYVSERKTVIQGFSASIRAGECVALTGANGAGKTTVLKMLAGMLTPTAGSIDYQGVPSGVIPKNLIGVLIGDPTFYPRATCEESLTYHMAHFPDNRVLDELLRDFGLLDLRDCPMLEISVGQRMRTALARAWSTKPSVILLDEPEANLDESGRSFLATSINEHCSKGGIAVLASHNDAFLETLKYSQRLWLERDHNE